MFNKYLLLSLTYTISVTINLSLHIYKNQQAINFNDHLKILASPLPQGWTDIQETWQLEVLSTFGSILRNSPLVWLLLATKFE
jgi:hypothetical protein